LNKLWPITTTSADHTATAVRKTGLMSKKSSENCEGRKGKDRRGEVLEEKEEDEASDVNDGMEDDEETRQIILVEEGEESEILTKSQKKELKRLKNLEWKWHRGENDPNPRHTEYYRQQLPELHEEWAHFQETMTKDLPVTFRLCTKRNSFVCSILKSKLLTEVSFCPGNPFSYLRSSAR
jgi:hypothetical protein